MLYSFSIRNGDGSVRETLGCTDLLGDYVARVFCDDVIRQMMPGNPDRHSGCTMDVVEGTGSRSGSSGERPARTVCSIAFP
jgi:hypothetical protein